MQKYYVYILANKRNGTLYVGFTDDIERRIEEHKNKVYDSFTKKYDVDKLVYYEKLLTVEEAKQREKRLKKWNREWKIELIEKFNPEWKDLFSELSKKLTQMEIMDSLFRGK